jgi:antiviral helicase SKI2
MIPQARRNLSTHRFAQ